MQWSFRSSDHSDWKTGWTVWAVSLALAYIAFATLGWNKSPNWDELWLLLNSLKSLPGQLETIRRDMVHPPLIYFIFRGWLGLFGYSEAAVKGLIILINSSCLVLFVWLAHKTTRHWRLASILFCSIYFQIGSVPNLARGYGLVLLCTVAAVALWREWSRSRCTRWLIGWALVMTVLVYTHYFGFLLLAAFSFVVIFTQRLNRKVFIIASLVPVFMILPWLIYVLSEYELAGNHVPPSLQWMAARGLRQGIIDLPVAFLAYIEPGNDPFGPPVSIRQPHIWQLLKYAIWTLHLVFAVMIVWYRKNFIPGAGKGNAVVSWFWRLFLIACIPVAALLFVSLTVSPLIHPRFLAGILPVYWLTFALIIQLTGKPGRMAGYLVLVPLVLSSSVAVSVSKLKPSGIRVHVQEVANSFRDGDVILGDSRIGAHVFWEWRVVQQRAEPVTVVRTGEAGHIPVRERKQQNVVPYHYLEDIALGSTRRVWYFYSSRKEGLKAERYFSNQGFRQVTPVSGRGARPGEKYGLLEFVSG
jgi:hypothetical protein